MDREGIICAGCWLVDSNKSIESWPAEETLAHIRAVTLDGGGPAHNVAMDLARLGAAFPLWGMGVVGDDDAGRFLLRSCAERNVDVRRIRVLPGVPTAHTDVMTVAGTGRRTFFHLQGANEFLGPDDFDFADVPARILHLGAPGLNRGMDRPHGADPNGWVTVLRRARAAGLRTNLEMVSAAPAVIRALVEACLEHLDTLIINDYEAAALTGLEVVGDDPAAVEAAGEAARTLVAAGVRDLVVVHFPRGCAAASRGGPVLAHPSLRVPPDEIRGANGAGDAFVAGVLYGLHEAWPLERSLELGLCAAATAMGSVSTTGSVRSVAECLALPERWGWRDFGSGG